MVSARSARNSIHLARAVHDAAGPGGPSAWARVRAIPRLVRAVRSGQYTAVSSGRLAMLLAGVGYVISPVDLVPEGLLLAVGLVDDVLVIGWIVTTLLRETEAFIAWEQGGVPQGQQWSTWQWSQHQGPPPGQTVPSHVVPD